ncbi:MAG TPA: BamA/TamA family outer membrane protein [Thermohalobaculum sp.]|nr:BamA/TamA family outer membrane protein [Thermohalobaculum sp.]
MTYNVVLEGMPSDEVTSLAEQSLPSFRLRDKGAASLAFLRRRAESDVETLLKILRSRGYYSSSATVAVTEAEPGAALVTIAADPGLPYTLTRHDLMFDVTGTVAPRPLDAAALGSPVGEQARSSEIAAAEAAAVAELHRTGFPYADFTGRSGQADPATATLVVESMIAAGSAYIFGPVTFEGRWTVDEAYLASYLPWEAGQTFDTSALNEFQRLLFATDLFTAVAVRSPPERPKESSERGAEPAPLPVTVTLEEGPRRRIAGGLRYDTDLGPTVRASFEHRNLLGSNERLLVEAEAGLVEQSLGLALRKPQFLRPGQDLLTDLKFLRTVDDAYDALSVTGFAGLERQVSDRWRGGLGGLAEISSIDDSGDKAHAFLLGAPFFAYYDGSNDLLDPTKGTRLRLEATPFSGIHDNSDTEFLVLDATGSIYQPLDKNRRFVIAARGRVASILAPGLDAIPATRRLYSGGGGSVRGYAQDIIGPLDLNNDPVGGRSALEGGVELRARLYVDIGGVVFADAGSVSTAMFPDFDEGVQAAAGFGLRYYSLAGPIRLDVAFPVNGRAADDAFQVYFSIGQAF